MRTKILFTTALIIFSLQNKNIAQQFHKLYTSGLINVYDKNAIQYFNPFAGGLKSPVIENFDLNNDKILDLVMLDRIDNKLLTFINEGNMKFIYRPEYEKFFPDSLASFIRLRDYNGDGKLDIFTYASSTGAGIAVYKNISNEIEGIKFELASPELPTFFYGNYNFMVNLPMYYVDIPEFIDIDNDGDLDILSFDELGGVWLQLYRNISMEIFGSKDSLLFDCVDNHWGNFYETETSNDVILNTTRSQIYGGYRNYNANYDSLKKAWGYSMMVEKLPSNNNISYKKTPVRHAGSTVMAHDMDGDNDLDLIIGDIGYPNLNYLQNEKNDNSLQFNKIKQSFMKYPSNNVSVSIRNMPNTNYIDIDNDGIKDFVFSPTDLEIIDTFQSLNQIWFYLNKGENNNPKPEFVKNNFLQSEMIDLGGASSPAFLDFDADGDMDLLITTKGDFYNSYYLHDRIYLYENTGNNDTAEFKLLNDDYLNFTTKSYKDLVPSAGDIDGDGDIDLLFGQQNGQIIFYENTAGKNNPVNFNLVSTNYKTIDVGSNSAPCLADVDRDGKMDLLIGQSIGKISFYKNTGTIANPEFTLVNDTFGQIIFPGYDYHTSPLVFDFDQNGHDDLILGIDVLNKSTAITEGRIYFYKDFTKNINAPFVKTDSVLYDAVANIPIKYSLGNRLRPAVMKVDGDTLPDLMIGNMRGGLLFFGSNKSVFTEITSNKSLILCSGDSILLDAGGGFDTYIWNTGENSQKIYVDTAKTYSCVVRKGSFTYTAYITIKQHNGIVEADFSALPVERDVQFNVLNDNIVQIHWDFGDDNFSFELNPKHRYLMQGNYKVCMSLKDGCGATDNICKNIQVTSNIDELAFNKGILVYPNPFNNNLYISLPQTSVSLIIKIIDLLGQVIYSEKSSNNSLVEIDTKMMKSGIYLLQLFDDKNNPIFQKLINK